MIEIKRGSTVVWGGKANGKQYKTVMQEDRVVLSINNASPVVFKIGDTVEVYGQTYKINRSENITRVNTSVGYSYEIEFESLYYDLGKWMLYTLDKNNNLTEGDVYIMSDARVIVDLIVRNANRVSNGWSVGVVDSTEVQQYTYNNSKLLTVLQDLADKNQLEFWVDGKVINLTRRQPNTGLTFEYGKGKGLYQVSRERTDDRVINTLRVLGGSRNLQTGSTGYGFRYLQPTGGNPLTVPSTGDTVEEIVEFANVYPRLIAAVTYVGGGVGEYNVVRSTDIDINSQLLNSSESAKIVFTTGQLAGFVFTIQTNGYDHASRQITFNRIVDDPAYPVGVPNTVLRPAVGDKFVLLDIAMPKSYITAAEAQLLTLGEQYLSDYSISRYTWRVAPTPKYILENNIEFPLGGIVRLKDTGLDIETDIRIGGYVRDIVEPHLYEITLTNVIKISDLVRQANATDRYQNTVSKGLSSDGGNIGKPTLASVTSNGKVTPLDITVYGTYNTDVATAPMKSPKPEDLRDGFAHFWFDSTAPAGEDPQPGQDFYISTAKDASVAGRTNGQLLSWDAGQNKWVARNEQSLIGYATQAWVNSQGFATQSWVNGQGFLKAEVDTLQSVASRGNTFNGSLRLTNDNSDFIVGNNGDIGLIKKGGFAGFFGVGRDTPFSVRRSLTTASDIRYSDTFEELLSVSANGALALPKQGTNSIEWAVGYAHSQFVGNPHQTQFSELTNKPTTLAGFGIGDAYTKVESDGRFKPVGWFPSWGEVTGKPLIDVDVTPNSIVQRDGSGYVNAVFFKDDNNYIEYSTPIAIYGGLSDRFMYKFSKQAVNQFLEIPPNGDTLQSVMLRGNSSSKKLWLNNPDEVGYPSLGGNKNGSFAITNEAIQYGSSFGIEASSGNTWWQAQRYDSNVLYNIILQPAGGFIGIHNTNPQSELDVNGRAVATVLKATGALIIPTTPPNTALMQAGEVAVYFTDNI